MWVEYRLSGAEPVAPSFTGIVSTGSAPTYITVPPNISALSVRLDSFPSAETPKGWKRYDSRIGPPLQFSAGSYSIVKRQELRSVEAVPLIINRPLLTIKIPPPLILAPLPTSVSPNNGTAPPANNNQAWSIALWLHPGVSVSLMDSLRRWTWFWIG